MTNYTHSSLDKANLKEVFIVLCLALSAAILIKLPALFGYYPDQHESFFLRNMSFFVLPLLAGYFSWKRKIETPIRIILIGAFFVAAIFSNSYPFSQDSDTELLSALHLPVVLWIVVGVAFAGRQWNLVNKRMDFVRFSGEFFIYYVLIALGGGVLTGFMAFIFGTIDIDIEPFFESWLLPCGAAGAVIIAGWLAESRNNIAANFAPVLARLFSPLFALMLITFLGLFFYTGNELILERNILIAFDLLLVVILGLLVYSISARNSEASPGLFDIVHIILIISALLADIITLWGISGRIAEFGFTPNRVTALGINLILLVNLGWSAVLYIRYLNGNIPFKTLEQWQTGHIPVYAVWAAIVVILFPPLFGYL